MTIKFAFLAVVLACASVALADSLPSNNATVSVPLPVSLAAQEAATCPTRDQILRLNQVLAVELVDQAFFRQLMDNLNHVNSSSYNNSDAMLGLPSGFALSGVQSNITLIVNQINAVVSLLNSTITNACSLLPEEDQLECYAYLPCNYTFSNLTNWELTNPATIHTNHSGNASSSSNSSSTNSTSTGPLSSQVNRSVKQGVSMSDSTVQYLIATIPLISNSTWQQQLAEFAVMHGQQASYLRAVAGESTWFVAAPTLSSPGVSRSQQRSTFVPYIQNPQCCDGFRGVRS